MSLGIVMSGFHPEQCNGLTSKEIHWYSSIQQLCTTFHAKTPALPSFLALSSEPSVYTCNDGVPLPLSSAKFLSSILEQLFLLIGCRSYKLVCADFVETLGGIAMVVVAAPPLNLMVPLAGYVLKELDCYDGRKLLGVTSVDTLRANAIYSEYIAQPNSILPVVGGASPQTRVPIFSHARPSLDLPEEDVHRLIDKIKSFDLNMDGPELKASTLERAYATVRLVNSLLSGLQDEPRTKEMALAKTSLIPEVNYFSLPVNLGKFGIERTFGLPQLSPLETEMVDYAIINLNHDLIKAQDLYASFKPCFEMLKSIVGGPSRCNDVTNEDCALLIGHKIDTRKRKDNKMKSNKKKRSEQHTRNRKRARANKFPILHCPAPEVVTDMPIEEKFGKIERVHKKLQVNQILQERNVDELPSLKCKEVSDVSQQQSRLGTTGSPSTQFDRIDENIDSLPVLISCTETKNVQKPFLNSEVPKTVGFTDARKNSKCMDKAVKQSVGNKNETNLSENVKVTVDLKYKIKSKNPYEHLQPHAQSQSSRIEMMKSLMQQKQMKYQNTKALCRSNSSTSQNQIEYLKKKAMELNTSNINRSLNKPNSRKFQTPQKPKKEVCESNNEEISGKEINKSLHSVEPVNLQQKENTNTILLENDSFDEQFSLLMENIEEQNGTKISEEKIKTRIETKGNQEMLTPKKEVVTIKLNEKYTENPLENKVGSLKAEGKISEVNYEMDQKTGINTFSENNELAEKRENAQESCSSKDENNEKALEKDNINLQTLICEGNKSNSPLPSADTDKIKCSELSKNKIIPEEKVTVSESVNKILEDKSDCVVSNVSLGKRFDKDIHDQNLMHPQINNITDTPKEAEKQYIKASIYDVTQQTIDEEISRQINESVESKKSEKEISKQKFSFPGGQMLDEGAAVIEIDAQEKLKELECLSKRKKRDELKEKNQKNTTKVSYDPLDQVNKIREITLQQIKDPLKYLNYPKQEENSGMEKVEETEKDKERKKVLGVEETKGIDETKESGLEGQVSESIEVFNYEPKNMHDTKNITNLNEIIQSLIKPNKLEVNSEQPPPVVQKSIDNIKGDLHVDSKPTKVKVINVKKKESMESYQLSKHKKQKKDDKRTHASVNLVIKKPPKETPFPYFNRIKEIPKIETFDKNKWLKKKIQPEPKEGSSVEVNLKAIDESKALTIHSRNINESFTKRIQKGHHSNKTNNDIKSISYAIDTKSKKDELSKRYTILKKGKICNMVKEDINADEFKAKLYQNSLLRSTIKSGSKRDDKKITNLKNLTESLKSPPTDKEISSSKPSSEVLEAIKKVSTDISKDSNDLKKINKSNNNTIKLQNKSFLNLIANKISKRSTTLNETTEAIGVRGSHYGSGTFHKKPTITNEQQIQQLTKKAKEQLNITRFKNNKRISPGLCTSLPVVSNELGHKRQPVLARGQEKTKSTEDSNDSMVRSRNKIQLMKEKYQRLKNANLNLTNIYDKSPPSGANFIKKKETKKVVCGIKNLHHGSSSKSKPESKIRINKVEMKGELSSFENSGKEIVTKALGGKKSEQQDPAPIEKDDSLNNSNTNRIQDTNSSEVFDRTKYIDSEAKCSELSQIIQNPTPSDDNNTTPVDHKTSYQDNQQGSQDNNKSIKDCFDKQQESPNPIEEENNIIAFNNTQSLKDEMTSNVEKSNKNTGTSIQEDNSKRKVFNDRTQEMGNLKSKEKNKESKDIHHSKELRNSASKEKSQQLNVNLVHKNALMRIKSTKTKHKKSVDKNLQQEAELKAVFSSRPTTRDLIKMKQEHKIPDTETANSRTHKVPSHNFGLVENKLMPRQSTASSLLLDPDIEKRQTTTRKVIHPSLMHAVKPFPGQNTDLTKLKTNFYSRWTPQTLKLKENKEKNTHIPKNESVKKNPFVTGRFNLTSDLFKEYMKKNRNYESTNPNVDVQFLHQSGQLALIPQQGVSANTSRINDQRAFSTLEANYEKKEIPKVKIPTAVSSFRFQSKSKPLLNEKKEKPQNFLFNNQMRLKKVLKESPKKEKHIPNSSYKPHSLTTPKNIQNKSNEKPTHRFSPFHYREKQVELKRMHLLKAFQNQENNELKFEELQRNYKQQLCRAPASFFNSQSKGVSKETPNRLQLLKRHSVESIKKESSEVSRHHKKPFSAPADYHPSFPLSKPKKIEKNNKKDESSNSLKKRWTQLLDIFQSVITTEKKNWEHDNHDKSLLVAGGRNLTNNNIVPKTKINTREMLPSSNSTAKIVQSYYRKHSVVGPKFQSSYSLSNRISKA
ncbi:unnamed protein product [Nezara viridula]|uniref:Lactate/malate dehydrogenase C-terminal domain-containing protein n=1 Tax=Nezara viridula TaxID=85310 RepID=A0A9P0HL72_NEZVI|nr:unnamed protein product [Nezara viridula]